MELKFDTGIPFNPKLIVKPKFKIGQTVYAVRNYYSEVRKLEITNVSLNFLWVDNSYRSFYKTTIMYNAEDSAGYGGSDEFTEQQLFTKKYQAQLQLDIWKKENKVQIYNYQKEEVRELEKQISSLKQRISDYEQEQRQRAQV